MPGIRSLGAETREGARSDLSWDGVSAWLRKKYVVNDPENQRRKRHKQRHELYIGAGDAEMQEFINEVFQDPEVTKKRQQWVSRAKFNNPLRRIVNEQSSVYSVPARRRVGSQTADKKYQEVQRQSRQHEMALRWNRWGNLHRNLAVGFRVREEANGLRRPVIDIVTPDSFFAIAHPTDASRLIGIGTRLTGDGPNVSSAAPEWMVWTDYEMFYLTKDGFVMPETVIEHGFARSPWMLYSLEPPAGRLLDEDTMEDVVAASRSVWFENVCLLKESKSATKQTTLSGDMAGVARGQAADSEVPVELGEGATATAIDMSMDLSMFSDTARYIYETTAANHGLSATLLSHAGVQSAEARELMRAPLKEIRREQEIYLREFEREFAEIQSMVLEKDHPELYFSTDGWSIDFGDTATPLDPKASLEVFESERRLGLTDTIDELQRRNPDLSVEQAVEKLGRHVEVELMRNLLMRPLQQVSGSMGADVGPPAPTETPSETGDVVTPTQKGDQTQGDAGQRANDQEMNNG